MIERWRGRIGHGSLVAALLIFAGAHLPGSAQQPGISDLRQSDTAAIIRGVDASVKNRMDRLSGYTVTEHYAVFRGQDETHPAAEMLVKTTYHKESGKSYAILSQSGSSMWRNQVLRRLLENERQMSRPGNVETALITSANYEMKLDKNSMQRLDGRDCVVLDIAPRRKSQYLFNGMLWVDARDFAIVQLKGTAAKSAFFLASAAEVTRRYTELNGLPMATHARAVSGSSLLGQTVVKVDYSGYDLQLLSGPANGLAHVTQSR